MGSTDEFFLVTNPESSGSPPKRSPPSVPVWTPSPVVAPSPVFAPSPVVSSVSRSESFDSTQNQELTVDDIEDFDDDDDIEEVNSIRVSRRNPIGAADLLLKLPTFGTGNTQT